jgi:putative N6-adenine-specific DNA methylase
MSDFRVYMSCPSGVEPYLRQEVLTILGARVQGLAETRTGVALLANWQQVMLLNLHTRLAQRVMIQVAEGFYRDEGDIYDVCKSVYWEDWFTTRQTFKIDVTAQHSSLQSLNFVGLKVKDAVADRFRELTGVRPDVDTRFPSVRIHLHVMTDRFMVYLDTSGEPLFKRGWRADKGDAPLKETLAAAMLAACGWQPEMPLYDPCCGSGTIVIEAAQMACQIAAGQHRPFGFQNLLPFATRPWADCKQEALDRQVRGTARKQLAIFGSDVSFRMVDFAERNAERAEVADVVQLRGGDALQRMPPAAGGVMLVNPPYGERIEVAGVAGAGARHSESTPGGREQAQMGEQGDFFVQLASHWKKNFAGWTAWVLTPDLKLPSHMRLKESRRVPMWNGPIACRLFKFDLVAGSARQRKPLSEPDHRGP